MNNKCNNCAKFLTCNKEKCKKIPFVEAGILDKPKTIKEKPESFGIPTEEAERNLANTVQKLKSEITKNRTQEKIEL